MKNKETIIYRHLHIKTGRSYIGKTTQDLKRRMRSTDKSYTSYRSCIKFYRALKKYGWEGFSTEVLEIVPPERMNEVDDIEAGYIIKYNSVEAGFNIKTKSEGLHVFPEDLKKKMSTAIKSTFLNGRTSIPGNKIYHQDINGIECKKCTKCNDYLPLNKFSKYRSTYDGLNRHCKPCVKKRYHETKVLKTNKIDYSLRRDAMRAGALRAYEQNPELKKVLSKKMSKPVEGTCIETGISKRYDSALAANIDGFDNRQISRAIATGKPHRGYIWKKV